VALAALLVAAWLFDRRARRRHRLRPDLRRFNDERYRHAGSLDPDLGAPPGLYARAEEVARQDIRRAAEAERRARHPDGPAQPPAG
jgi:hypothetical protein